jgi:hypothetical protein
VHETYLSTVSPRYNVSMSSLFSSMLTNALIVFPRPCSSASLYRIWNIAL